LLLTHTATTATYALSLHDALPISRRPRARVVSQRGWVRPARDLRARELFRTRVVARLAPRSRLGSEWDRVRTFGRGHTAECRRRSEEHTSELQSPYDLVCRLLLEK